jgi:alginate O-acetyltransferase complex protein AlgJ
MIRIRKIWTVLLLVLILLPASALLAGLVPLRVFQVYGKPGLRGVVEPPTRPPLTVAALLDRSWLRAVETRAAMAMGRPRGYLIRMNNGIAYAFGRIAAQGIEFGTNRQLHQIQNVDDWCLRPALKDPEQFRKLAEFRDMVEAAGKTFLVVMTPSKAAIYPETLPARCRPPDRPRAYDTALDQFRKYGLDLVDTHQVIAGKKRTQSWPLFGRDGVHWNDLGAAYAASAIFSHLRERLGRGPLLHVRDAFADFNQGDDGDLGELLNLPYRLRIPAVHPVLAVEPDGPPPTYFIIGTSFNFGMLAAMSRAAIIDRVTFMFYFRQVMRYEGAALTSLFKISREQAFPEAFSSADIVIVEVNEGNIDYHYIDELLAFTRQSVRSVKSGG